MLPASVAKEAASRREGKTPLQPAPSFLAAERAERARRSDTVKVNVQVQETKQIVKKDDVEKVVLVPVPAKEKTPKMEEKDKAELRLSVVDNTPDSALEPYRLRVRLPNQMIIKLTMDGSHTLGFLREQLVTHPGVTMPHPGSTMVLSNQYPFKDLPPSDNNQTLIELQLESAQIVVRFDMPDAAPPPRNFCSWLMQWFTPRTHTNPVSVPEKTATKPPASTTLRSRRPMATFKNPMDQGNV